MVVRGATELETHIVSVERIKEYIQIQSEVSRSTIINQKLFGSHFEANKL